MASPFLKTYEPMTDDALEAYGELARRGFHLNAEEGATLVGEILRLRAQQQAFADGYEAHRAGRPASACPHGTDALPLYHAWKFGWKHRDWHARAMRAEAKAGELLRGGDGGPVLAGSVAGDLDWEL